MSFTSDVKSELTKIETSTCCKISECYGILLFGRAFSEKLISVSTESEEVVERLCHLLQSCYSVQPHISGGGTKRDYFTVSIDDEQKCTEILNSLGYFGFELGDSVIKYQNIEDECCKISFIRGAFLASGMVSDPNKEYHAEFPIRNAALTNEFYEILCEMGLKPKISARGSTHIIYFKESENIEDLLTTIQATNHTLELAGIKVYKDMRNHYNRLSNCEVANISKTVNAAVAQKQAIEKIKQKGAYETLSGELKFAAELRQKNPEASLTELVKLSGNTITKSGLNHRLNRLVTIAKNL
ncbi:MAG: DNA-binding protein WhiA [Ruminococcaceae bacterium]|nr:DNA-binding protein WhiA [Oscillospiraceae bacterium]